MRDQGIWSVGLGRWNGVQVRLHMFFLLFAVITIYLSWQGPSAILWQGPVLVCVLFCSVVIHEVGHVFVANRVGGHADEVVLGPLGGLAPLPIPADPQGELVSVVAGPLVNLFICLLTAGILAFQPDFDPVALLSPLAPGGITTGAWWIIGLKMTFWVNWVLVLVNLIPAFPFDGGRGLKAAILCMRPKMEPQSAVSLVATVAKLTALGLLVIAWLVRGDYPNAVVQTWFALVLLAIFVFFSARQAERTEEPTVEDGFMGYDFSEGYTSLDQSTHYSSQPHSGSIVGWFDQRRQIREKRKREHDALEDGRVDEILAQVHDNGMESLSSEDRELLQRASARYKKRDR